MPLKLCLSLHAFGFSKQNKNKNESDERLRSRAKEQARLREHVKIVGKLKKAFHLLFSSLVRKQQITLDIVRFSHRRQRAKGARTVVVERTENFRWVNALSSEQRLSIINYTWIVFNYYTHLLAYAVLLPPSSSCCCLCVAIFYSTKTTTICENSKDSESTRCAIHSSKDSCWYKNLTHFLSLSFMHAERDARMRMEVESKSHLKCD